MSDQWSKKSNWKPDVSPSPPARFSHATNSSLRLSIRERTGLIPVIVT
jgi:hypothetical protein